MKLLLIEDDSLLAESLKDNGYQVDLGASLRAAEAHSTTEIYALVIMDLGPSRWLGSRPAQAVTRVGS